MLTRWTVSISSLRVYIFLNWDICFYFTVNTCTENSSFNKTTCLQTIVSVNRIFARSFQIIVNTSKRTTITETSVLTLSIGTRGIRCFLSMTVAFVWTEVGSSLIIIDTFQYHLYKHFCVFRLQKVSFQHVRKCWVDTSLNGARIKSCWTRSAALAVIQYNWR